MSQGIDKDKIMARLKKLLALASSPNANEAAAAMRQAQKLMQMHAISEEDVQLSDVSEQPASYRMPKKTPLHIVGLGNLIAQAFGVRVIRMLGLDHSRFHFIGIGHQSQIAEYSFDVLRRRLTSARADYLKTLNPRLKRSTKTNRADLFCRTWLYRIAETLEEFAGTEKERLLLESYWQKHHGEATKATTVARPTKARDEAAAHAGYRAAAGVTLHHGVSGKEPSNRLAAPGGRIGAHAL